jgi:hypothetical protein
MSLAGKFCFIVFYFQKRATCSKKSDLVNISVQTLYWKLKLAVLPLAEVKAEHHQASAPKALAIVHLPINQELQFSPELKRPPPSECSKALAIVWLSTNQELQFLAGT